MSEAKDIIAASIAANVQAFWPRLRGQFSMVPEGYSLQSLEAYQDQANRIRAKQSFADVKSLVEYLKRFEDETPFVTADYEAMKLNVVLDYSGNLNPQHHDHSAAFQARLSSKFAAWDKICNKALSQIELGHFLEKRAVDVVNPDAADIIEMVMKFEATKTVEFKTATRLQDGSRQITFVEDAVQRGSITLPDHITLMLPVLNGSDPQPIKVWLRFRIEEAKLKLILEIHDRDELLRDAFDRSVDAFKVALPFTVHVTG